MDNYFDFIKIDPEEENAQQFRDNYCAHIIKHLSNKN